MFLRYPCRKAQNVLEYIVLLTAIIVVIIAVLAPNRNFSQKVNKVLKQPLNMIDIEVGL